MRQISWMAVRARSGIRQAKRWRNRLRAEARRTPAKIEPLEARQLMAAATVFISEFLADNVASLLDQDHTASDWIELHNPTGAPVNLDGYYLTDKKTQLTQWRIPAVTLAPNGYLTIFASSKNRAIAGQELHTNFALSKGGEYLALTAPDGVTVLSSFDPAFPAQQTDISYGTPVTATNLISVGAASRTLVPTSGALGSTWTAATGFDDSAWTVGTTGVGFNTSGAYNSQLGTNIQSAMLNQNASAYVRIPFTVADPTAFDALSLRMQYNDGFVAYLNGVEIARRNAPASLLFNSKATTTGPSGTGTPEGFDLSLQLSLLQAGTNVLAIQGLNASATSGDFIISPQLTGLKTFGNAPVFLTSPTPNRINVDGYTGAVADTKFDHDRGLYSASFNLTISTATIGATIRYTLDGSAPSETNGLTYSAPIPIVTTTTVRAMAYLDGYIPTNVDTQSYIFPTDVLHQGEGAANAPLTVYDVGNGSTAVQHTAMNQGVVSAYSASILAGLSSIPTISIVANFSDIWGPTGFLDGTPDRPGSIELIDPSNSLNNFQVDAALDLHSHLRLKQSINLKFKAAFGASKLVTNLLQNSPLNGETATNTFDKIVLRAGNNRSWARNWNADATTYTEDQWFRDSQMAMGDPGSHGNFVQVYINGAYWGLYNAVESPNDAWDASYYGGKKDDWFAVSHDGPDSGNATRWNYLTGPLLAKPMSDPNNYAELKQYLDVNNFANYLILAWYQGTTDWPSNNWWAGMRTDTAGPLHFTSWDGEWSWDRSRSGAPINGAWVPPEFLPNSTDSNVISKLWRAASKSPEFMQMFADQVYRAVANGGALTDQNSIARWDTLNAYIRDAVTAESARWGDALSALGQPTRTRDVDWQREVDKIRSIMNGNAARLLTALRSAGYYPSVDPGTMSQQGGTVGHNYNLKLTNPNPSGVIYYTIDGSDPRLAGGGINPNARVYGAAGVIISADTQIRLRILAGSTWSALNQANFIVSLDNIAPVVSAGNPQTITLPSSAALSGTATDDGLPIGGTLTSVWSKLSGPGDVVFGNVNSPATTASFSASGSYVLRLTASDGALSNFSDVAVTVLPAPSGPQVTGLLVINTDTQQVVPGVTLVAGANNQLNLATLPAHWSLQAITAGTTVGSVRFGYDATANFRTENTAPWFFNGDYVPFTFTPGSHTVNVTAFTGAGATGTASAIVTYALTIINVPPGGTNQAPTVSAGNAQAITLPSSATLLGTASDDGLPNGVLTTTWSKFSGPGTVTFGNINALNTTASFSSTGGYVLRLTASDGLLSSTSDVAITVSATATGPAVTGLVIINTDTEQPVAGITLVAGVPNAINLATLPARWSLQALTTGTVGSVRFSYDATVNFRTENTAPWFFNGDYVPYTFTTGTHTVNVTAFSATNGGGTASAVAAYSLVITNTPPGGTNQAPVVNAGNAQTITLPNSATLAGTANDDGLPNGSTLTTTWSKLSGPGTVTFGNINVLTTTATFSAEGTYVLRLIGSDGALSSTPSDVTIVVNPASAINQPPVVNAGSAQTITLPNSANLAGTANDDGLPNGSTLTTTWSKLSGPGTVTFGNAGVLNTTATFSSAGTYVLRLIGSDGTLSSTPSDVTINVNAAPTGPTVTNLVVINTDTEQPVAGITLVAGASNTLNLATLPAHWSLQAITSGTVGSVRFGYDANANFRTENTAPWFFNGDYVPYTFTTGTHTVKATAFSAANAGGTTGVTQTYTLVITNVPPGGTNQPPVVNAGNAQTISLPNSATLIGSASDDGLPVGGTLTTTWSKFSGPGTVTFGNINALNTTASFSAMGTYVLRLIGSDGALSSTPSDVTIVVNPAGQSAPTVTSLVLINTDTEQAVPGITLTAGVTNSLSLASLPAHWSLQAITTGTVGSVRFGYDGNTNFRTENTAPWFFNGDYVPFAFTAGTHTITVTAFSATNGGGTAGTTVSFVLSLS